MERIKKERAEFIDFYANKIREDKEGLWRQEHKRFINSQINNANKFYERLVLTRNGKEKFMRVTNASKTFTDDFYEMARAKRNVDSSLDALNMGKVSDL
jgi:DNA-binding MarR family transcriptional regulator